MKNQQRPIDYYALAREFVKEIRSSHTQREFSEQLGYSFNKVGKWESGVTQVKWKDVVDILRVLSISLEDKLKYFFPTYSGSGESEELVKFLKGYLALDSVADATVQRLSKKWKAESVSPDFAEILLILDLRPAMMIGFLSQMTDCAKLVELQGEYDIFLRQQNILSEDPVAGFVVEALQVGDYTKLEKHDDVILARHSGCSVEQLKKTLANQLELKTITFDGNKYHSTGVDFSYSNLRSPEMRRFNKYTLELAASKYRVDGEELLPGFIYNASMSSHRVVAMSPEAAAEVSKLVSKLHNEISEVVKNDSGKKENVQLITLLSIASSCEIKK